MRVIFMGTPGFAVEALRTLVLNGYDAAAVYTRMDKPSGRGQAVSYSPVKQAALDLDVPVVQPASLKNAAAQAELASFNPDLIVVAAYGLILPTEVLSLPRLGCINIHPSLLPRHRGAAPVMSTILAGDQWGGVSLMKMDAGLDTGPIIAQSRVMVRSDDTTESLTDKLSLVSAQMLIDVLPSWTRGEIQPRPQDDSQATYFKMVAKEAGEIDWKLPSGTLWRQVRAYQPWPGSYTRFDGKVLKILEALPMPGDSPEPAGKVVALGKGCGVVTGAGVLELRRVQLEGKQPVSASDFARGQRGFIGSILGLNP
jgi:methionyl-tRNA formyltransferase